MKVYLFSTGSIQIPGPTMRQWTQYYFPMVCALIDHPQKGLSLVDCGFGSNQLLRGDRLSRRVLKSFVSVKLHASQTAKSQIQRLGYSPGDVQRIFLTHMHWDHCDALSDFPQAQIIVHPKEKAHAFRFLPPTGYDPFQFFDVKDWKELAFQNRHALSFNRSLDYFGDGSLIVVELPGHSPGHQGVYLPSEKLFLTGDAFFEDEELTKSRIRPYQVMSTHNHWFRLRTLQRLRRSKKQVPELAMIGSHSYRPPGGWPSHPIHWEQTALTHSI